VARNLERLLGLLRDLGDQNSATLVLDRLSSFDRGPSGDTELTVPPMKSPLGSAPPEKPTQATTLKPGKRPTWLGPDQHTRATAATLAAQPSGSAHPRNTADYLVVIYTKDPTLLGKRFVLENSPTRVGRAADNHIVLDGDSVSRRHSKFEQRSSYWIVVDEGSSNGTFHNDEHISREVILKNGDRIKIGPTIFKFLSGADVEAQYHEEIYRMTTAVYHPSA
jgi:pSer/pThr/pTyr-binding forkhead associated (FHA) protein